MKLSKIVGKGYYKFWNSKHRYLVVKGSRGSKKSATTSLKLIYNIMKYPGSNAVVVRRYHNTHLNSTYAQLLWAINKLGVNHLWKATKAPLELTYIPTGQQILFRGFDNATKLTSITVKTGHLCWVWVEEAFEITNEKEFNKLDLSIRGELPPHLWKQIIITFNPWSEKIWLKARFFDKEDDDILSLTTTYMVNEFLGKDDIKVFEKMKEDNPTRYAIEGLGHWGVSEGLVFDNWRVEDFDVNDIKDLPHTIGLDFGYTNDPTAMICSYVDVDKKVIYIHDEHYQKEMLNDMIAQMIKDKLYHKEVITADSSEPKSIASLKRYGIVRIKGARKGKDSVMNGISFLQEFTIVVHSSCDNTIMELSNYRWDEKDGNKLNKPIDEFNHLLDALRYSMERFQKKQQTKITKKDLGL